MSDTRWVPVARSADVTGPPWRCHEVEGVAVRLIRDPEGEVHAIGAACPHLQAPLDRAEVEGDRILCPRHWYEYDLASGANVHPGWGRDVALAVFPVDVIDGMVHVDVGSGP